MAGVVVVIKLTAMCMGRYRWLKIGRVSGRRGLAMRRALAEPL